MLPSSMEETWKDVPSLKGHYQVSNLGNVRRIMCRPVKGCLNSTGYKQITAHGPDIKKVTRTIHSMVAEAFIGPRPQGAHIAHWNNDRADNRLENLRYATPKENIGDDRRRHDTLPRGERNYKTNFKESDIIKILQSPEPNSYWADIYGVTKECISRIRKRKSWAHVDIEDTI